MLLIPRDLSRTKHASVHYLFAAVLNIRSNLSDTPAMLVTIDTMFKSMNVLHRVHTMSQVDVLTCTLLVLTSLLGSAVITALGCCIYSQFLHLLLSTSLDVSLSLLNLYCSLLHQRQPYVSIQHKQWTPNIKHSTYTCRDSNLLR